MRSGAINTNQALAILGKDNSLDVVAVAVVVVVNEAIFVKELDIGNLEIDYTIISRSLILV